jgi:hypothetical protein
VRPELTEEQKAEMDATIARLRKTYGEKLYACGTALGTISNGLLSLCHDEDLTTEEKKEVYDGVAEALQAIIESLGDPGDAKKICEIAAQIDSVVEHWSLDNLEKRRGLN